MPARNETIIAAWEDLLPAPEKNSNWASLYFILSAVAPACACFAQGLPELSLLFSRLVTIFHFLMVVYNMAILRGLSSITECDALPKTKTQHCIVHIANMIHLRLIPTWIYPVLIIHNILCRPAGRSILSVIRDFGLLFFFEHPYAIFCQEGPTDTAVFAGHDEELNIPHMVLPPICDELQVLALAHTRDAIHAALESAITVRTALMIALAAALTARCC